MLLLIVLGVFPALPASAELELTSQLRAGAGYDSNAYLQAGTLPTDVVGEHAPFVGVMGWFQARLGSASGHHLALSYRPDFRQLVGDIGDSLLQHDATLSGRVALPLGFGVIAAATIGHYLAGELEGADWLDLRGRAGLQRALTDSLRAELSYGYGHTSYGALSSASSERRQQLLGCLAWRILSGLTLQPEYAASWVHADPEQLDRVEHSVGLSLSWAPTAWPVMIAGGYRLTLLGFDPVVVEDSSGSGSGGGPGNGPGSGPPPSGTETVKRADTIHEVLVELAVTLADWVALTVDYQVLVGRSNVETDYSRHQVVGGARFSLGWSSPSVSAPARGAAPGGLTVQLRDSKATQVAVVGSFNGWNAREGRLRKRGDRWVGSFDLPAGKHRYMLWVDGDLRLPPDCERWVPDGFGGKTCLFRVD